MRHDIILWGASGFTGRLVAEQLALAGVQNWALAGRSESRLKQVRDAIPLLTQVPLITADAGDPAALRRMTASARVIISTVGPYMLHGGALVAACAATGTDYVDLCGEPLFMRDMIDAHDEAAAGSGARIVFSCGFDSIPFDLGVWHLQQRARARLGHAFETVKARVLDMRGGLSGGTEASFAATMARVRREAGLMKRLNDPFLLTPGFAGPRQPAGMLPRIDRSAGGWVGPFMMATINTKNVHRTNFLLGHPYGATFRYEEMKAASPLAMAAAGWHMLRKMIPLGDPGGPGPGEGPSQRERDEGCWDILFTGTDAAGETARLRMSGDRDPGYGSTSRMIVQAALCLIEDIPGGPGGVTTPGAIMADPLLRRLTSRAGFTVTAE